MTSDGEGEWVPAFPSQRPPFAPGHELSLTHGAYSPRKVEPLAKEIADGLMATAEQDSSLGYLRAPAYRLAVWGWARAEAQVQLVTEYLMQAGEDSGDGVGDLGDDRVRSAYLLLHRAEARAQSGRRALGLDPLSRARLGKDVAQGRAADAAAELTRMREEHERARLEGGGEQ